VVALEEVGLETEFHQPDLLVAIMPSVDWFISIARALANLIGNPRCLFQAMLFQTIIEEPRGESP
jgi:hypothetical protein